MSMGTSLLVADLESVAPVVLHPGPMTDEQFLTFCAGYEGYSIESNAKGEIVVRPPVGGESSNRNVEIGYQLSVWARRKREGIAFASNCCFRLPNGARRCPDTSWVTKERVRALPVERRRGILPLAPDFLIELMSPSDRLRASQTKMQEYMANGVELGWLIDPDRRTVYVYRGKEKPRVLTDAKRIEGEGPVAGFSLDLRPIWRGLGDI